MSKLFIIFISISLCTILKVNGQDPTNKIIFEQKALDYFADSLLNKVKPFKDFVARFNGKIDSSITTIQYEMTKKYAGDTELYNEYQKAEKATDQFWQNNKRAQFTLNFKKPIKKNHRHNNFRVFQYKNVGIRNYVWFRTFIKRGDQGYDIYFIMDNNGKIINWYYDGFIF